MGIMAQGTKLGKPFRNGLRHNAFVNGQSVWPTITLITSNGEKVTLSNVSMNQYSMGNTSGTLTGRWAIVLNATGQAFSAARLRSNPGLIQALIGKRIGAAGWWRNLGNSADVRTIYWTCMNADAQGNLICNPCEADGTPVQGQWSMWGSFDSAWINSATRYSHMNVMLTDENTDVTFVVRGSNVNLTYSDTGFIMSAYSTSQYNQTAPLNWQFAQNNRPTGPTGNQINFHPEILTHAFWNEVQTSENTGGGSGSQTGVAQVLALHIIPSFVSYAGGDVWVPASPVGPIGQVIGQIT